MSEVCVCKCYLIYRTDDLHAWPINIAGVVIDDPHSQFVTITMT